MAPVKKKRVWNFSFDIPSADDSPAIRKRRRFMNAAARKYVVAQRRSIEQLRKKEATNSLELDAAACWQQLRFVPPFSETQRIHRRDGLHQMLQEKVLTLAGLLQLYKQVEKQNRAVEQASVTECITRRNVSPSVAEIFISRSVPPLPLISEMSDYHSTLLATSSEPPGIWREIEAEIVQHRQMTERTAEFLRLAATADILSGIDNSCSPVDNSCSPVVHSDIL